MISTSSMRTEIFAVEPAGTSTDAKRGDPSSSILGAVRATVTSNEHQDLTV